MRGLLARLLLVAFLIVSVNWLAHANGGESVSVNTNDEATSDFCADHFAVSFDKMKVFRAEEERTIPRASISKLSIHGLRNGGILVRGWDGNDVHVKACKAAAAASEQEAQPLLDGMKLEVQGGNVTVPGLEHQRAWVHLLVQVPKQMAMEFETHNGPLSVHSVSATTLQATTTNGPVSLKDCAGKIMVDAQNGPVSLVRSSGDIRLHAQNGPMEIELSRANWEGEGLEASTRNGPLDVKIPAGYHSGVEVRSDGHSPFSCRLDACQDATKDWDDNSRVVRFGGAGTPLAVRLSTVNGPVTIRRATASF